MKKGAKRGAKRVTVNNPNYGYFNFGLRNANALLRLQALKILAV
jgi:hypothetical protein